MSTTQPTNFIEQLVAEQRYSDALAILMASQSTSAHDPQYLNALGVIYDKMGNFPLAIDYMEQAIALRPDDPVPHWSLALALLVTGQFDRGWQEFESRLKMPGWPLARDFSNPQWKGEQDLSGKTILLHAEGGHGDAIQFCRYIPMVQQRGARIILECHSALVPLLKRLPFLSAIFARGDALPDFDFHSPLQSLPLAFKTQMETIPRAVHYLVADRAKAERWDRKLGPRTGPRIGLTWCGSIGFPDSRSRTVSPFAPLMAIPGLELHGVQTGPAAAEYRRMGNRIIDHSADLTDFDEAAALVSQLDLVITVDTAIAHLAGAMGKEVWVLVPKAPDFRWLLDRSDSPWYPTMRLFRQHRKSVGWDGVALEIGKTLKERLVPSAGR